MVHEAPPSPLRFTRGHPRVYRSIHPSIHRFIDSSICLFVPTGRFIEASIRLPLTRRKSIHESAPTIPSRYRRPVPFAVRPFLRIHALKCAMHPASFRPHYHAQISTVDHLASQCPRTVDPYVAFYSLPPPIDLLTDIPSCLSTYPSSTDLFIHAEPNALPIPELTGWSNRPRTGTGKHSPFRRRTTGGRATSGKSQPRLASTPSKSWHAQPPTSPNVPTFRNSSSRQDLVRVIGCDL